MKLPSLALDPKDLNPVHCCVCVNIGDQTRNAETVVAGYAVCRDHSVGLDEVSSLREYIELRRTALGS